jgi:hypothetical protein
LIVLNNKTISVKDGGFYSYVVTTPSTGICWALISHNPRLIDR